MANVESSVSALATSLANLGKVASSQAISATSSDPGTVTVSATSGASPASYVINSITSPATAASERSLQSYADSSSTPVSSTGSMQLIVGSNHYTFNLAQNNLLSLRDQINSLGAGVTASILTTSGGNYLSPSSNATGATTLQVIDDPITPDNPNGANTQWLTGTDQGANAVFQLNGINVSEPSNVINDVIPGVTFTIQAATTTPVTLSLASDPTQLSSALQNFVTNYNQLRSALNQQEGPAGGLLSGDTSIVQAENVMRQLAAYQTSSGSIRGLSDLGIEFDTAGNASFNQTTFSQLTPSQLLDAFHFIGSANSGLGGISSSLQELSDPITGLIKTEQDGLNNTDKSLQSQITTLTIGSIPCKPIWPPGFRKRMRCWLRCKISSRRLTPACKA